jgi:hypothetical protein
MVGKWLPVLLWTLAIVYGIVGAMFVWTAGGWLLVGGCWLWSASLWYLWFWVVNRSIAKRIAKEVSVGVQPDAPLSIGYSFLLLLLAFALTSVIPGILAGIKWGPDVGFGMAFLGLLAPFSLVAAYLVFSFPKMRRSNRIEEARKRFEAQFDAGPIGVWRAKVPHGIDMEPGCQIVFQSGGHGRLKRWQKAVDEAAAPEQPFHWTLLDKRLIEVSSDDSPTPQRLVYLFLYCNYGVPLVVENGVPLVVRLVLRKKEWIDRLERMSEPSDVNDDSHWPGSYLFFAYTGECANDEPRSRTAA